MTLKQARTKRKLTQEELEEVSGVDQSIISRIERGELRNPGIQTVVKLATALKVNPGTLVFGTVTEERAS
jgi:transcriptional regulator with XRE-family HTH domain